MKPCAVVASSCTSISPLRVVQAILDETGQGDPVPEGIQILDHVNAYPWEINTKYYSAQIHLNAMHQKTLGNQEFAESIQAMVLYFDSISSSGLSEAERWLPFIKEYQCDVKILVCEYCSDHSTQLSSERERTSIDHLEAVKWCIKYGFELVELDPIIDTADDGDLEDDFPETVGVKRIVEALHAHIWPNMNCFTKKKGNHETSGIASAGAALPIAQKTNHSFLELDAIPSVPDHIEGEGDDMKFEALFEQLSLVKSKASNLPSEDRKDYAEKFVVAFWRAMGGDEKEIENLLINDSDELTE